MIETLVIILLILIVGIPLLGLVMVPILIYLTAYSSVLFDKMVEKFKK